MLVLTVNKYWNCKALIIVEKEHNLDIPLIVLFGVLNKKLSHLLPFVTISTKCQCQLRIFTDDRCSVKKEWCFSLE